MTDETYRGWFCRQIGASTYKATAPFVRGGFRLQAPSMAALKAKIDEREGKVCRHPAYVTFGGQNYPYDIDRGPYCPVCREIVDL